MTNDASAATVGILRRLATEVRARNPQKSSNIDRIWGPFGGTSLFPNGEEARKNGIFGEVLDSGSASKLPSPVQADAMDVVAPFLDDSLTGPVSACRFGSGPEYWRYPPIGKGRAIWLMVRLASATTIIAPKSM
ncbi:MAG: hypothetical protein LCH74_19685 [Proteobacteria bacterium]|nr:hypothetical protein [Pseudomonadota bacterium]